MISFSDMFAGEQQYQPTSSQLILQEVRRRRPVEPPPEGLLWDWRQVSDGAFAWRLVPAGDTSPEQFGLSYGKYFREFIEELRESLNPLAAMCHHKDTHSTERLPESTAKEAQAGICAVAGFDHRPGAWK